MLHKPMSPPFPGMNPYLEHPDRWTTVHNKLIVAIADVLTPLLLPRYQVDIEKRIYEVIGLNTLLVGRSDISVQQPRNLTAKSGETTAIATTVQPTTVQPTKVSLPMLEEVREAYLEVRETATQRVVTVLEILSPSNKKGSGRSQYEEKRQRILASPTHLVEIDLLREGEPLPMGDTTTPTHYRLLVSRADERPMADLYGFNLQDLMPRCPIPIAVDEPEPQIDLKEMLDGIYERSGYSVFIDYTLPPCPAFAQVDQEWLEQYLSAQNLC